MTFQWHFTRKKDARKTLEQIEKLLICEHPRIACEDCERHEACLFMAALWRAVRKEVYTK